MTSERQFDALLRSWLDASTPSDTPQGLLESVVTATAHARPRPAWLVRLGGEPMPQPGHGELSRFAPLAVAATALIVALLIGIRVLIGPPNIGPPDHPSPSQSAAAEPSASASPPRAAGWTATGSMFEARAGHTATLLADGTVLVAGGRGCCADEQGNYGLVSAELYDPATGTWTATGSMNQPRAGHTATLLLDGRVLVTGGWTRYPDRRSAELYDPATGTWTATGATSGLHDDGTATLLLDGTVLLAGGASAESAELYHPASGSWSDAGGMIEQRVHHAATLLSDGKVLLVGGYGSPSFDSPDRLASAELYDPATGTWTAASSMNEPRAWIAALLLRDGRVMVAGGEVHITSAELYDPASGTWTPTGNSDIRGTLGTYTLLGDGRVLAEGACCGAQDLLATAATATELFNPVSGTWTATPSMDETQFGHTATLLTDGTVLVAGGFVQDTSGNETPLASAELYEPGSGS